MTARKTTTLLRAGFVLYFLTLTTLTHWPRLELPTDIIERPDLVAHLLAFGLLEASLIAAAFFGPRFSTRNIALSTLVAAAYAPIDELTQSLPGVNRHTSGLDMLADLAGIAVVALAALLIARFRQRAASRPVDDPSS